MSCWKHRREKTAPQLHSFSRSLLPTCLRDRPPHKGRGREPELREEGHEAGAGGGSVAEACRA